MMPFLKEDKRGWLLSLYVQPGAAASAFAGLHGEALKLRIAAAALDGQANKALCTFLAESFGVSKSSIEILKGHSSRSKLVLLSGDKDRILSSLQAILANPDQA